MITVVTFGYGHPAGAPDADLTLDLRPFRDPHIDPAFRYLTAYDQQVIDKVASTPGVREAIADFAAMINRLAVIKYDVTAATGCVGGRHRGPAGGILVAAALRASGHQVHIVHRDIDKPVINR